MFKFQFLGITSRNLNIIFVTFSISVSNWNDTEKISMALRKDDTHKSRSVVAATACATGALSCGTGDRMDNERKCLEKDMRILDMNLKEDDGGYERIAVMEQ